MATLNHYFTPYTTISLIEIEFFKCATSEKKLRSAVLTTPVYQLSYLQSYIVHAYIFVSKSSFLMKSNQVGL